MAKSSGSSPSPSLTQPEDTPSLTRVCRFYGLGGLISIFVTAFCACVHSSD
jgi:hypothetical protein